MSYQVYDDSYIDESGAKALTIIEGEQSGSFSNDIVLEGITSGIELTQYANNDNTPLIFITTNPDEITLNEAELEDVYNFIVDQIITEVVNYKFQI